YVRWRCSHSNHAASSCASTAAVSEVALIAVSVRMAPSNFTRASHRRVCEICLTRSLQTSAASGSALNHAALLSAKAAGVKIPWLKRRWLLLQRISLLALFATALPHAARAQTADDSVETEEIIVTARKRTETVQDVPLAIQALTGQRLEQLNASSFDDYV